MSFTTAKNEFLRAQQLANSRGDAASEALANGLAELAKAMSRSERDLQGQIQQVQTHVRRIR